VAEATKLRSRYSQCPWQQGRDRSDPHTLLYGKAARSLGIQLGYDKEYRKEFPELSEKAIIIMSTEKAQDVIDKFFDQIPGAYEFIQGTIDNVANDKFTETLLGNRRWFWDIMDLDHKEQHLEVQYKRGRDLCWCSTCKLSRSGERAAVNHIIQGSAADIVRRAMIRCSQDPELKALGVRMLLQVHDELVFEVPNENVEEALPKIQYWMEHPGLNLRVPLRAAPGTGQNWSTAK
jgi:DNA polymerase-1